MCRIPWLPLVFFSLSLSLDILLLSIKTIFVAFHYIFVIYFLFKLKLLFF